MTVHCLHRLHPHLSKPMTVAPMPFLPLLHKDLFASGLRKRSSVLLYDPFGTGRTLLTTAIATECVNLILG
ncbi:hypothetical protein Ahy_A03g013553 isoform B [Arachis hypogaea]|uniref:ATPase AAA-type core domain-containing protein n=1 Tax=Arachis hypogaea TaxID=3818 RepID=A0A445DVN0_ARAHY|nr:hypothetical protein Ahy_A03g013553 isoform B [Arachis hypogaea]